MSPTTPCPPWCTADHGLFGTRHTGMVGEDRRRIEVMVQQYTTEQPSIAVVNLRAPLECRVTEVEIAHAPGLAALLDTLGQDEPAAMVREAAEVIEEHLEDEGGDA
ncbi:hypothetical protein ACQEU3_47205 [Spirillospora sp. CA-253888]